MEIIEATVGEYTISSDPDRLDRSVIHEYLSNQSYWAAGRKMETVERSVAASINLGAYASDGSMVGAARIVTDGVTFGWLCDVFVVEGHRGRVSELGLLRTEIQTERRNLTTFPNLYLVTNPVTVVRSSGTFISS